MKVRDADTIVEINIVHLGRDTLQPQAGAPITFTHEAVSSQFSYRPETPAGQKDYGMGGDVDPVHATFVRTVPMGLLSGRSAQPPRWLTLPERPH